MKRESSSGAVPSGSLVRTLSSQLLPDFQIPAREVRLWEVISALDIRSWTVDGQTGSHVPNGLQTTLARRRATAQHMQAHAIDIRIPGIDTLTLYNAALALGGGGVGYLPALGLCSCRYRPRPHVVLRL